jgi:hypothetical protein
MHHHELGVGHDQRHGQWAMFCKHDRTENVTMMFETRQHMVLFSILLGDFLSQFTAFKG